MTQRGIEEMAMFGATTIVAAMATDTWSAAREGAAQLFRRGLGQQAHIEVQLDANAALVGQARDADRARGALTGLWQLELEAFLTRHPDAAEELGTLIVHIQAGLPEAQQQWVQHNTARDHSLLNAVQHGTQHNYYMDCPDSRLPAGLVPDESDS